MDQRRDSPYFVPTTSKTLDILEAFAAPTEELTLEEIVIRARIARTTALRILYTLEQRRYITRRGKRYRLNPTRRKIRMGFGSLTSELDFAQKVAASLLKAANDSGMEVVVFDNQRDPQAAIQNARRMVEEKIDVAIEFQRHADVSPVIADIFGSAGIPLIAVHIPHPGAIYFGVNNYQCGITAGNALAEVARKRWNGRVDLLLLLDIPEGGIVLQSRMTGVLQALEAAITLDTSKRVVRTDSGGERAQAKAATVAVLRQFPKAKRILVSASSDDGALGALDALKTTNRDAVIVGMEGSAEAVEVIARGDTAYLATVGFFPDQYGPALVELVLSLVNGDQVPPSRYVDHELIDRAKARELLHIKNGVKK